MRASSPQTTRLNEESDPQSNGGKTATAINPRKESRSPHDCSRSPERASSREEIRWISWSTQSSLIGLEVLPRPSLRIPSERLQTEIATSPKRRFNCSYGRDTAGRGPEFEDSSEFFWEYSFAITLSQPATRFSAEKSADIPEADRDHLTNGEVLTSV